MTETAETGTELALFPKLNLPSVTGITEEMNKSFGTMYTRIEAGIAELPQDMTVKANREKVASYAYSISRTKTGLDEAAAGVAGDAKLIVDAVNVERRQLKTTLDKLRDKARAPLDTWEREEEAKEERRGEMMGRLLDLEQRANFGPSARLRTEIADLMTWTFDAKLYGEAGVEALENRSTQTLEKLRHWAEHFEKAEAEAAELEQLRAEKAAREEADRIAAEQKAAEEEAAAQAERDRIERERIAEEARQEAKRELEEQIAALQRQAQEEEVARHNAEVQRKKDAEEAEARIEREREAAAAEAAREATRRELEAAQRVRDEQRAEQERIERERLAKEKADRERAADIAHRRKLNGEAATAIMKVCGLSEKDAQNVVIAIYKEQVPHVAIAY